MDVVCISRIDQMMDVIFSLWSFWETFFYIINIAQILFDCNFC